MGVSFLGKLKVLKGAHTYSGLISLGLVAVGFGSVDGAEFGVKTLMW